MEKRKLNKSNLGVSITRSICITLAGIFVLVACAAPGGESTVTPPTREATRTDMPALSTATLEPAPPSTQASPAGLDERVPVTLEVAPQFQIGNLTETRSLTLPAGFQANVFAAGLVSARFMTIGPEATIFVTGMESGQIYALPDRNRDGVADEVQVWADGLNQPHGIAFHEGYLYVGETNRIVRFQVSPNGVRQGGPEPVVSDLPSGSGHWTRTVVSTQMAGSSSRSAQAAMSAKRMTSAAPRSLSITLMAPAVVSS
jgi:glucose/arabinose dehydrogenase